jgi:hypothetical protein
MTDKTRAAVAAAEIDPATPQSQAAPLPEGALLNETQIQWLRRAVVVMTTIMVAGIVLLVGRVIYLARASGTQAGPHATGTAPEPELLADVRLKLPVGAMVKSISSTGSRLAILHSLPDGGDAISVVDLVTGKVVSRVAIGQ